MEESIPTIKRILIIMVMLISIIPTIHGTQLVAQEKSMEITSEFFNDEEIEFKEPEEITDEFIEKFILENTIVETIEEDHDQIYLEQKQICSTTSTFKSYMDYRAITNTNSQQYILQQQAYTDNGYRIVDGRIVVAMADSYVGEKLDIELSSGEILNIIVGDIKAGTMCEHPDGSMIEFIVDTNTMDSFVKQMGNYDVLHNGTIVNIYRIG